MVCWLEDRTTRQLVTRRRLRKLKSTGDLLAREQKRQLFAALWLTHIFNSARIFLATVDKIWLTRDSVTPSTSPISFKFSSST